jgi:signal transduction histidine kinase
MSPSDFTHPDDRQLDLEKFRNLAQGRTHEYVNEKRLIRKDGKIIWVRVNARKLASYGDRAETIASVIQDITAQKTSEEESIRAKQAAESANAAKSTFLANMSHEIRTPLGAIMGFSELLVDDRIDPAEKSNFVAAIKRNGEMLSNIINDILDLAKVEAGKMDVNVRESELTEILTDITALLGLQATEKGIDLKVAIDDDAPEKIKTDPLRLRQILINVIGNAIKFTDKGAVSVSARRSVGVDGQELISFVVDDTGKGIAKDQIGKLFAPFSQANDTAIKRYGGTGLGLILSKDLARLLGGDVVLTQTELGALRGSCVDMTLSANAF